MSNSKEPKGKEPGNPAQAAAKSGVKRPRGRPPRITAEAIIAQTMELLATRSAEEISIALVATSLAAPPTSIYNYFPNSATLLNAVGDHAFSLFRFGSTHLHKEWREALLAWLWALQRHCARHPIAFKIMSIEGHSSKAWTRARAPVLQILQELGFEKQQLAFAMCWFTNQAIGLMYAESVSQSARRNEPEYEGLEELPASQREQFQTMRKYMARVRHEDVLEFGFTSIVHSLALLVEGAGKPRT
jgi:AcrR family transcriptional regulator